MENYLQHQLPELELPSSHIEEALRCALHTIIFAREPNTALPQDIELKKFPMSYTMCQNSAQDVKAKVDNALRSFTETQEEAGPYLHRCFVTLKFSRLTRVEVSWWGMASTWKNENIVWEEWILPILVNSLPPLIQDDRISADERSQLQYDRDIETTMLFQNWMMEIYKHLNQGVAHIPDPSEGPNAFKKEITCHTRLDSDIRSRPRAMSAPMPFSVGQL